MSKSNSLKYLRRIVGLLISNKVENLWNVKFLKITSNKVVVKILKEKQ